MGLVRVNKNASVAVVDVFTVVIVVVAVVNVVLMALVVGTDHILFIFGQKMFI